MDTEFTTGTVPPDHGTSRDGFVTPTSVLGDGDFALARRFIEHLQAQLGAGDPGTDTAEWLGHINWEAIQRAATRPDSPAAPPGEEMDPNRFFAFDAATAVPDFGDAARLRAGIPAFVARHRAPLSFALSMLLTLVIAAYAVVPGIGQSVPSAFRSPGAGGTQGNAELLKSAVPPPAGRASSGVPVLPAASAAVSLPAASAPPAPAPPTLAGAPPLRSHEVFGFAPYWTLAQSGGFDVSQLTTIAYFSIGVNPDGSLNESGPGWNGFQSQALADLVTRAHAAGDRVVLTVNCFDQSALDQLTSSPTAPSTLSSALIAALQAKNLDGVNLDFEGKGSADQAGLTNLVSSVSAAVHAVNPHYQVTMDTYASAAGDPNGFYDIRALNAAVDAFFVMDYELNLQSPASATSPLTSGQFSESATVSQYAGAVPPSKVILGLPYFGIDWPTSDGTLTAQATGPATPLSYSQIAAGGHPVYWDSTTDTAWTSYQVGSQWHETFFQDPRSLYDAAQMAGTDNLGGVGIWALGMDGNDPGMLSALDGFAPVVKDQSAGPAVTTPSVTAGTPAVGAAAGQNGNGTTTTTSTTSTTSTTTQPGSASGNTTTTTSPFGSVAGTIAGTSTGPTTTTTTTSGPRPRPVDPSTGYWYSGTWEGQSVNLTNLSYANPGAGVPAGELTGFTTNDPADTCLEFAQLTVREVPGSPDEYFVVAQAPAQCATAYFAISSS